MVDDDDDEIGGGSKYIILTPAAAAPNTNAMWLSIYKYNIYIWIYDDKCMNNRAFARGVNRCACACICIYLYIMFWI